MDPSDVHPSLDICNLLPFAQARLFHATDGFEELVRLSGHPADESGARFILVFHSVPGRRKFKKNSKWFARLRRDHNQVLNFSASNKTYQMEQDGFLVPTFKLSFLPPLDQSSFRYSRQESEIRCNIQSGDFQTAETLSRIILSKESPCVWEEGICHSHLSLFTLSRRVAEAFDAESQSGRATETRNLSMSSANSCKCKYTSLAKILLHITQKPTISSASEVAANAQQMSQKLLDLEWQSTVTDQKLLQLHSFAFALQCYKIGLMDLSLSHLQAATVAGEQVGADRESFRVLLATRALCGVIKGNGEPDPMSKSYIQQLNLLRPQIPLTSHTSRDKMTAYSSMNQSPEIGELKQ